MLRTTIYLAIGLCFLASVTAGVHYELQFTADQFCQSASIIYKLTTTMSPPFPCQAMPGTMCIIKGTDPNNCIPQPYFSIDGISNVINLWGDDHCTQRSGPPLGSYRCNLYFGVADGVDFRRINYTRYEN